MKKLLAILNRKPARKIHSGGPAKLCFISLFTFTFSLFTHFCAAQYTTLYDFNTTPEGENPYCTLVTDGTELYGMTDGGGVNGDGCIFYLNKDGSNFTYIWNFDDTGSNGSKPNASLIISGNILYGMAYFGGRNNCGVIFSIHTDGTGYTDLWDFSTATANGEYPAGSLTLVGNLLYGMTQDGGANSNGIIFSIDTNGNGFTDLYDFDGIHGKNPSGNLTVIGSVMYGMTYLGGAYNDGLIFAISTTGGGFTDLLDFDITHGANPNGSLTQYNGNLYGMTEYGGAHGDGLLFSVSQLGNQFKDLLDFDGLLTGANPNGNLTASGNTLLGMTPVGGLNSEGCIFSIDTNGSGFTQLYNFSSVDGSAPYASLLLSGDTLFGVTSTGGTGSNGVVFSFEDKTLGVNEVKDETGKVNVYPNPSNGVFAVGVNSDPDSYREGIVKNIEVYNVLGETVYSNSSLFPNHSSLDLSNQPSGIYLYRVIANSGNVIGEGKLVIQK